MDRAGSRRLRPARSSRDVPAGHWAGAYIEALASEGITGGCGAGAYCPGSPVSRAEMAVFLTSTFGMRLY